MTTTPELQEFASGPDPAATRTITTRQTRSGRRHTTRPTSTPQHAHQASHERRPTESSHRRQQALRRSLSGCSTTSSEGVADHLTATAPAKAGRPTTGHNRSSTCHGMVKVSRLVTDPATAPQLYQHPTGSRTHPQPDPVETSPTPAPALITYTSFDHTSSSTTGPPGHTTNAARLNPHISDSRPADATSQPQD
jgi:hypothetical protein